MNYIYDIRMYMSGEICRTFNISVFFIINYKYCIWLCFLILNGFILRNIDKLLLMKAIIISNLIFNTIQIF